MSSKTGPDDPSDPFASAPTQTVAAWTEFDTTSPSESLPTPPPTDGRYTATGELGRGGMGVVHAVSDLWLDRPVALKRPRDDAPRAAHARLLREARLTSRLTHPGIPPIHDVGEDSAGPFYTMPVLEGRTLREALDAGDLGLTGAVRALAAAAHAVGYAHEQEIVHRDLKPSNLLLGTHGEVWVMDWGVAADAGDPQIAAEGTPHFRSPQQGEALPPASTDDVYSLGRTLQEILLASRADQRELDAVVSRCTASAADERYPDGHAVAVELEHWLDGRQVEAHAYTVQELLWRQAQRWRAPLAVGGLASLLLAAGAAYSVDQQRRERDRAVAAERVSEIARAQSNRTLSEALGKQAAALALAGHRAPAETLAAAGLTHAETPLARGAWMAFAGLPRPTHRRLTLPDCDKPVSVEADWLACSQADGVIARFNAQGAPLPPVRSEDSDAWDGRLRSLRETAEGTWALRADHTLAFLASDTEGTAIALGREPTRGRASLTQGGLVGVAAGPYLGRLTVERGEPRVTWGPPRCEDLEAGWIGEVHSVAACRRRELVVMRDHEVVWRTLLASTAAVVTWQDGPVVATFGGQIRAYHPSGEARWGPHPTGVGPAQSGASLPGDRLAVLGEGGDVAVWCLRTGRHLITLPGPARFVQAVGSELALVGRETTLWTLPETSPRTHVDRAENGGFLYLDLEPGDQRLLGGTATGHAYLWDLDGGARHDLLGAADQPSSAGAFFEGSAFVSGISVGTYRWETGEEEAPERVQAARRWFHAAGGELWATQYGTKLDRVAPEPLLYSWGAPTVSLAGREELWAANRAGEVARWTGDEFETAFRLEPGADEIDVFEGDVVAVRGRHLERFARDGTLTWSWKAPRRLTALHAGPDWVAVGDQQGVLHVVSGKGTLLARVQAHDRRISDLDHEDGSLWSASWDGHLRRWGMGDLRTPAHELAARAQQTWGLRLEDVLGTE